MGVTVRNCGFWAETSFKNPEIHRLSGETSRRVPPRPPPEERPLAELGAGAVALAVLGDVGRAGAGGVQAGDDGAGGELGLPVDRAPDATEGEAGVDGLAEP